MLVSCIRDFHDRVAKAHRFMGETFEVTPERLQAINGTRYGQLVQEVAEGPSEQPSAPQRARRRKKTEE